MQPTCIQDVSWIQIPRCVAGVSGLAVGGVDSRQLGDPPDWGRVRSYNTKYDDKVTSQRLPCSGFILKRRFKQSDGS